VLVLVVGTPGGHRINVRLDGKAADGSLALVVDDLRWMDLLKRNRSITHH